MRLKMFLQINNLISYCVIMGAALFGVAVRIMRVSIQNLTNGYYLLVCPGDVAAYGKNGQSACRYHPLLRTQPAVQRQAGVERQLHPVLRSTAETGTGYCRECRAAGRPSGHAGRVLVSRTCWP